MKILNVRVDAVNYEQTLSKIKERIESKDKGQVVTVNPEMVILAQTDKTFAEVLKQSFLNVPDGVALIWASKLVGQPLSSRVTGADLIPRLVKEAATYHWRIFLLGSSQGVAAQAARRLESAFKTGPIQNSSANPDQAQEEMKNWSGDIVLVAYGHGKQEKWIAENMREIKATVFIGVGGALDYISGSKKRAPLWIRKLGLEWFYRLLTEPWRVKRQLALPEFILRVLWQFLSGKR